MRKVVLSGINLYVGGPLTVFYDCLDAIVEKQLFKYFDFIVLVSNKKLFEKYSEYVTINEFPKSRKSWLYRLYYEFYYFKKYSRKIKSYCWFSLHDISPSVDSEIKIVYCHNPSPFYKIKFSDLRFNYRFLAFSLFYKYLYSINLNKNTYIVVQQIWFKNEFCKMYKILPEKIIVARPKSNCSLNLIYQKKNISDNLKFIFFYPSLPRQFKNFEIICDAVKILSARRNDFSVKITIDGSENSYSRMIFKKYQSVPNLEFIGLIPYANMSIEYDRSNCLIFPSRLETWGLPISEYISYMKPMILADLPYAHETSIGAEKVVYFDPGDAADLALKMESVVDGRINYVQNMDCHHSDLLLNSWNELFEKILRQ